MQQKFSKNADIVFEAIANIIREEREKQNKSQRILADEFDIPKSIVSRLENAKNPPMFLSVFVICEALGITFSEFARRLEKYLPEGFSLLEK